MLSRSFAVAISLSLCSGLFASQAQPPTTSAQEPLGLGRAPAKVQPRQTARSRSVPLPPGGTSAAEPEGAVLATPVPAVNPQGMSQDDAPTTAAAAPAGHIDPPTPRGTCQVPCQSGDRLENEPDCFDGYTDTFNGGCNFTPNAFGTIACGESVCGRYGTYVSAGGQSFRDTDWYHFTLTQTSDVTWTATGEARTRVFILGGACPAASLGSAVADPCMPATVTLTNLAPGTYSAFVGTDAFSGIPCGMHYRATLTTTACCSVPPQPGDRLEGEPDCFSGFSDTFNGGCNFTPNVFGTIACGETIAGRYGTYQSAGGQNFRDTDWYHFTVTVPSDVTWTAIGEARTRVFILGGACPAASLGSAAADPCMPATVTLTNLAPGTYSAFVGTDAFSGIPCGLRYRATLATTPCCIGAPQPDDQIEGEPDCFDGYTDTFNGGCNFTPNAFGDISCGRTVRGRYGTYVSPGGQNFRDTDWYHFTLTQTSDVTWTVTGEARTRVFILGGVCPAGSLGSAVADPCMPATITLTNLAPGTYSAFVGTDAFSGVPCGLHYRATLTTTACCSVPPQPGDRVEGEPDCSNGYADNFNGGCNFSPNFFGSIECGETIAGHYGTYVSSAGQNFRDTDWYRFTLPQAGEVTWTAVGEVRTRVFILAGACPAASLGSAVADACMPASITLNLGAGTYSAFVGTDGFSGVPCGKRYRATLSSATLCPPCAADFNHSGAVNSQDFFDFLTAFFASAPSADFNHNGVVNSQDFFDFLTAFFNGC